MALDPSAQIASDQEGRVDLVDRAAIADSPYYNPELAPVPLEGRTWTTYNFFALWMGMAHNIPSYTLAASLVALGMDWVQALLTITLGNLIVLAPMLLNSHAGTKYGIPFPVFARAFYGVRGANLVALLRAFVACAWFGIQTWVGGKALHVIVGRLAGEAWTGAPVVLGQVWTLWLCFLVFWAVQMLVIWRGMEAIRRFENWTAPLVSVGFLVLLAYVAVKAGGFGPILSEPSKLGWGPDFWKVFFPALMGMIAFWSTLSLNMPDFTRFGGSQRKQALGQVLGLPTTMTFIAVVAILTTSGAQALYGEAIWDPAELASRFDSTAVVLVALVSLVLATVSANLAANVVSPSYDFSNAFPRRISFAVGGLITGVLGVLIQPWRLISDPGIYIFAWLGFYGGLLASVAGVLVAGYWVLARTRLELPDLYLSGRGAYWFTGGWNWRAVVATALGSLLAVGGAHGGPFPADGLIPPLKPLYDYNWVVGLVVGMAGYLVLAPRKEQA
ncbi:NCS1 family nucleobase:cation symporter-1 [Actinosynnema pretiosum subsp. pretiosum]|uniref:NCS1 nucleoside transporter family n=2 Tax=Actinosynnema TaxID=40566 RepID=C6WGX8_ACTMD|nr:NCS1 family nucleobase:cation symporter-1 [Actinosynnema mirum]ACU36046.1 NCS1 nucleoside transporter family [Actinosynnema mirum DSM 43827]QUF06262.1 NCS1 family nucleobase:cation symporter-1 [Actinosynnema pretiosum subsp. pretiosum]